MSDYIIDLGKLAEPANTLILKVSEGLGGAFRPAQIRRVAKAKADADKIRAIANIEIKNIERRALQRFVSEETMKQKNIESITKKALPELDDTAKPQNIENDWIANFFDKSRLISDDEMQNLWAKILAGEANAPGKYSKRTINLIAGLDKSDAELFSRICSYCFTIDDDLVPFIYDTAHKIYTANRVNFDSLAHLASIGLIYFDANGYKRSGRRLNFSYFGLKVEVRLKLKAQLSMYVGLVLLTKPGQQLAPISGATPREGFVDYVREEWKRRGFTN